VTRLGEVLERRNVGSWLQRTRLRRMRRMRRCVSVALKGTVPSCLNKVDLTSHRSWFSLVIIHTLVHGKSPNSRSLLTLFVVNESISWPLAGVDTTLIAATVLPKVATPAKIGFTKMEASVAHVRLVVHAASPTSGAYKPNSVDRPKTTAQKKSYILNVYHSTYHISVRPPYSVIKQNIDATTCSDKLAALYAARNPAPTLYHVLISSVEDGTEPLGQTGANQCWGFDELNDLSHFPG
jgi:hypothetical protein